MGTNRSGSAAGHSTLRPFGQQVLYMRPVPEAIPAMPVSINGKAGWLRMSMASILNRACCASNAPLKGEVRSVLP